MQKSGKKIDVWMPIYIGDYLADTQRLTTEQHGAYLLLLFDYWRNGPLPADDAVLAQITGLKPAAWRKMRPVILGFFKDKDGRLVHSRVEAERVKAAQNQERRTERAKKAADVRWHQEASSDDAPSNAPSMPQAMPGGCPLPSPSSVSKETAGKPASPAKELIDRGVRLLTAAGVKDGPARSFIAQCRKESGDAATSAAFAAAERLNVADPRGYIRKCLQNAAAGTSSLYASIDRTFGAAAPGAH